MKNLQLISAAREARGLAQARYSNFHVGAALLTKSGKIYTGCNIESSSYGLTICAERVALFKAVSEGETEFEKIAIISDAHELCPPCGACRQVLWDYTKNISVILANDENKYEEMELETLLPKAFEDDFLNRNDKVHS